MTDAYTALVDGRSYSGSTKATAAKAMAWATDTVDTRCESEAILPTLQANIGTLSAEQAAAYPAADGTLAAGAIVAGYSRNRTRLALVLKVGTKNALVAYVTPSNPEQITRKSIAVADLRLVTPAPAQVAETPAEPVQATAEAASAPETATEARTWRTLTDAELQALYAECNHNARAVARMFGMTSGAKVRARLARMAVAA